MSITTDAVIMIGLEGKEFTTEYLDQVDETGKLFRAFPWYDANPVDCIFGLVVAKTYSGGEIDPTIFDTITTLKVKFFYLTGLEGKVFLTTDVC
jgi:hypothetical protein